MKTLFKVKLTNAEKQARFRVLKLVRDAEKSADTIERLRRIEDCVVNIYELLADTAGVIKNEVVK